MNYQQFIFDSYEFDPKSGDLELHYSFDKKLKFTEHYRFDFPFVSYNPEALDKALQMLFLMAGISYYKTFIPAEIVVNNADIDLSMASCLSKTYQRGLGEFWYINQLDPRTPVNFPVNTSDSNKIRSNAGEGLLIGIGGGKDSLVSIEMLRNQTENAATWSLNHRPQLTPLVEHIGMPHFWVERRLDPKIKELIAKGAYNGHVPISAILACAGTAAAILAGKQAVVTSNERSANEPTLQYRDTSINHQYSKSTEFEQDFQAILQHSFGKTIQYYSFLRPLSELLISEIFAEKYFDKYKKVFCSCNRAFIQNSSQMSWCGECPKCAFTFLAFTPFLERKQLENLFSGKNLLLNPVLDPVYRQLLGIEDDKPLECVGEVRESRVAMRLAQDQYPQLKKYEFELFDSYDYRALADHNMPPEIHAILAESISK